jgi:hypothetical protein
LGGFTRLTPSDQRDAWWDFRRRRRFYFGVMFGGIIAVPLLSISFEGFFADPEAPYFAATAIWIVALLIADTWLSLVKCPRCGRYFFRSFWFQHILLYDCIQCHTPRYSKWDSEKPAAQQPECG